MPLDPSIILRGIPPPTPVQSPLEVLSVIEQMRNRREQAEAQRAATEERRLAGEERRQKAADEAAARQRAAAVEQRVQAALIQDPTTGRPTLDWAKLLEGGEVPSATIFKLGEETDQATQRLATLESTNLGIDEKKTQMLGTLARPVAVAGYAKPAWDAALLAAFNKKLITAEERDAGYAIDDPAAIKQATEAALAQAGLMPKPSELQKIETVDAEGREVTQFVTPTEGATYPVPPPAPPKASAPPAVGSFEDYVVRRYGPTPTFAQITQARKDYQQADDRPRITVNTGAEGGLPPRVETTVRTLGTAFRNEPAVKRTTTMAEAVSFIRSLSPTTTNPADDQGLIYAFAKAMDPESVVREGEYATVQKYATSWLQRFGFDAMRVLSSETPILTTQARANLKATITSRYQASRTQYDNLAKSYTTQINRATGRTDGSERLTDYAAAFPSETPAPAAPPGAAPKTNPFR